MFKYFPEPEVVITCLVIYSKEVSLVIWKLLPWTTQMFSLAELSDEDSQIQIWGGVQKMEMEGTAEVLAQSCLRSQSNTGSSPHLRVCIVIEGNLTTLAPLLLFFPAFCSGVLTPFSTFYPEINETTSSYMLR